MGYFGEEGLGDWVGLAFVVVGFGLLVSFLVRGVRRAFRFRDCVSFRVMRRVYV